MILKLSLLAPTTVQPPNPFRIKEEMAAFDEAFPALPQQSEIVVETPKPERVSHLKGAARERYDSGKGGGPVGGWLRASRWLRPDARAEIAAQESHGEDLRNADAPQE